MHLNLTTTLLLLFTLLTTAQACLQVRGYHNTRTGLLDMNLSDNGAAICSFQLVTRPHSNHYAHRCSNGHLVQIIMSSWTMTYERPGFSATFPLRKQWNRSVTKEILTAVNFNCGPGHVWQVDEYIRAQKNT